jgi:hypothetical protein
VVVRTPSCARANGTPCLTKYATASSSSRSPTSTGHSHRENMFVLCSASTTAPSLNTSTSRSLPPSAQRLANCSKETMVCGWRASV